MLRGWIRSFTGKGHSRRAPPGTRRPPAPWPVLDRLRGARPESVTTTVRGSGRATRMPMWGQSVGGRRRGTAGGRGRGGAYRGGGRRPSPAWGDQRGDAGRVPPRRGGPAGGPLFLLSPRVFFYPGRG